MMLEAMACREIGENYYLVGNVSVNCSETTH